MSNTSTRFHSLFVACKFNYAPLENVGDMSEIDSLELYDPIHLEFHRFMIQLETSEAKLLLFLTSTYRRTESSVTSTI